MKSELRKSLMEKRKAQSEDEILEKSHQIMTQILSTSLLEKKKRVLIYKDFRKEVKTDLLIDYLLKEGYEVALPRVSEDFTTMALYLISGDEDMAVSSYGILEPIPSKDREIAPQSLDLILAPGVGFTPDCYRMGYGGGFYDKMLNGLKEIMVCGLAFDCQIVDQLPLEDHDQQLDMVITESKIYRK